MGAKETTLLELLCHRNMMAAESLAALRKKSVAAMSLARQNGASTDGGAPTAQMSHLT